MLAEKEVIPIKYVVPQIMPAVPAFTGHHMCSWSFVLQLFVEGHSQKDRTSCKGKNGALGLPIQQQALFAAAQLGAGSTCLLPKADVPTASRQQCGVAACTEPELQSSFLHAGGGTCTV